MEKGNQNNMASLHDGFIPLVSAKKCDNGYKQFITVNHKKIFEGRIITLNNDGDGGAGIAYYQPHKMALDSHCTALVPKQELTQYQMLFFAMCITNQRKRFGHGYALNSARLRSFKFMLPVIDDDTPDFEYMSSFMRQQENEMLKKVLQYFKKRITA